MRTDAGVQGRRDSDGLAAVVELCRGWPEFLAAVSQVLAQADRDISSLAARCLACGSCCEFDLSGQRLMVSAGELAYLLEEPPPRPGQAPLHRCPYQVGPLCTARRRRPLGCRTFFCRGGLGEQAAAVYERHHTSLRRLHEEGGIPYIYVELTDAVAQLSRAPQFGPEMSGDARRI
ncbi:MAG: hypothetical protein ACE15C_00065 [Phycisphaerae bacterium]